MVVVAGKAGEGLLRPGGADDHVGLCYLLGVRVAELHQASGKKKLLIQKFGIKKKFGKKKI